MAGHSGTSLLLKNLILVPRLLDSKTRAKLRVDPENHAVDASLRILVLMGAAGLQPIVEHHGLEPGYCVALTGPEYLGIGYRESHFKLSSEAQTIYPNRPIGASVFGDDKGGGLDVVCPDVVAFLVLDSCLWASALGPFLFSVEQIEKRLSGEAITFLRENRFRIEPDQTLKQTKDLGYGGIQKIRILGKKSDATRPDGRKYMRLAQHRMFDDDNGSGNALMKLNDAITHIIRDQGSPIDLERGDVLLVNNRRVATSWGDYTLIRRPLMGVVPRSIAPGDRCIVRMSFYSPNEITDHLPI